MMQYIKHSIYAILLFGMAVLGDVLYSTHIHLQTSYLGVSLQKGIAITPRLPLILVGFLAIYLTIYQFLPRKHENIF